MTVCTLGTALPVFLALAHADAPSVRARASNEASPSQPRLTQDVTAPGSPSHLARASPRPAATLRATRYRYTYSTIHLVSVYTSRARSRPPRPISEHRRRDAAHIYLHLVLISAAALLLLLPRTDATNKPLATCHSPFATRHLRCTSRARRVAACIVHRALCINSQQGVHVHARN